MRKGLLIAALVSLMIILLMPSAAFAAYPTMNGTTYYGAGSFPVYNMNGGLVATYRGMSVVFASQSNEVVGGTVRLYQASSIRGTALTGGTGSVYLPASLAEGNNTVVVMSNGGDLSLVLPAGVSAIATSGSAAVTGSPLSLAAGGTRTIPTTTSGLFTLAISRTYTTVGTFSGVIGDAAYSKPRFQLAGTQTYATATQDSATLTGSPKVLLPGANTLDVTVAGTINIAVPYGMRGTAASGTATIGGSPVTLLGGATTAIDTGATTGTVTVTMRTIAAYNIAGTMNKSGASIASLSGRIDGFLITDYDNYTVYQMNKAFKLNAP